MFADELEMGSLVLDINTNRLDAVFLRDTGAIDDHFTIIKGGAAEPLRLATIKMGGGKVIAIGTPEEIARAKGSATGELLGRMFERSPFSPREKVARSAG